MNAHRGSVKELKILDNDEIQMTLTDKVSVFDWGPLPQEILKKGFYCSQFAYQIDQWFKRVEIPTATVRYNADTVFTQRYAADTSDSLVFIPLEWIFRLKVAEGSSLIRREPQKYTFGQELNPMIVEMWTKRERIDRLLEKDEALKISGLDLPRLEQCRILVQKAATILAKKLKESGLLLWDGKFELAFDKKRNCPILIDLVTPDELRLTTTTDKKFKPLSKEPVREYYRSLPWFEKITEAKKTHGDKFVDHSPPPPPIPSEKLQEFSKIYKTCAEKVTRRNDL